MENVYYQQIDRPRQQFYGKTFYSQQKKLILLRDNTRSCKVVSDKLEKLQFETISHKLLSRFVSD